MKTIMDAVNELRGELSYKGNTDPFWCNYISYNRYGTFDLLQNHSKNVICTREEFNTLISELETNFGQSITYNECKTIRDNINWSEAPARATHYIIDNDDNEYSGFGHIEDNAYYLTRGYAKFTRWVSTALFLCLYQNH